MRTATTLLAENYLAQDRKRIIHCIDFLEQAARSIDGGMWTAEVRAEQHLAVVPAPAQESARTGGLIARAAPEPVRQAS
jgi:hypothetical protein